jgi:hypothetical protein
MYGVGLKTQKRAGGLEVGTLALGTTNQIRPQSWSLWEVGLKRVKYGCTTCDVNNTKGE